MPTCLSSHVYIGLLHFNINVLFEDSWNLIVKEWTRYGIQLIIEQEKKKREKFDKLILFWVYVCSVFFICFHTVFWSAFRILKWRLRLIRVTVTNILVQTNSSVWKAVKFHESFQVFICSRQLSPLPPPLCLFFLQRGICVLLPCYPLSNHNWLFHIHLRLIKNR